MVSIEVGEIQKMPVKLSTTVTNSEFNQSTACKRILWFYGKQSLFWETHKQQP